MNPFPEWLTHTHRIQMHHSINRPTDHNWSINWSSIWLIAHSTIIQYIWSDQLGNWLSVRSVDQHSNFFSIDRLWQSPPLRDHRTLSLKEEPVLEQLRNLVSEWVSTVRRAKLGDYGSRCRWSPRWRFRVQTRPAIPNPIRWWGCGFYWSTELSIHRRINDHIYSYHQSETVCG